jgi:hypothetical protein
MTCPSTRNTRLSDDLEDESSGKLSMPRGDCSIFQMPTKYSSDGYGGSVSHSDEGEPSKDCAVDSP